MEKARPVDLIAPLGGVLLLASAFLEWFRYPDPEVIKLQEQFEVPAQNIEAPATMLTSTGWEVTSLRYVLYLCAITAIVNFFLLVLSRTPGRSIVFNTPVALLGLVTSLWIVMRWINPPFEDASILNGLYAGLAGALLVTWGTFMALRDERVPSGFDHAPPPEMLSLPANLRSEPSTPLSPGSTTADTSVSQAAPAASTQPAPSARDESVGPPKQPGA